VSEIAHARSGRLEGARSRGGFVFRGVPYAAPPLGALRFRAPQPVAPWREVRAATRFGASAPQMGAMNWLVARVVGAATGGQSEDCLTLNVWTPALDRRRRAVLVFVHGGAFVLGSGSTPAVQRVAALGARRRRRGDAQLPPRRARSLALRGVLPDGSDSDANLGLRDQLAGLEWVRDNIDAFGGDPGSVTVFGESAGAMSLGALLASPRARGLFRRAILQSGAAHNVSSPAQARRVAEEFRRAPREGGREPRAAARGPAARSAARAGRHGRRARARARRPGVPALRRRRRAARGATHCLGAGRGVRSRAARRHERRGVEAVHARRPARAPHGRGHVAAPLRALARRSARGARLRRVRTRAARARPRGAARALVGVPIRSRLHLAGDAAPRPARVSLARDLRVPLQLGAAARRRPHRRVSRDGAPVRVRGDPRAVAAARGRRRARRPEARAPRAGGVARVREDRSPGSLRAAVLAAL